MLPRRKFGPGSGFNFQSENSPARPGCSMCSIRITSLVCLRLEAQQMQPTLLIHPTSPHGGKQNPISFSLPNPSRPHLVLSSAPHPDLAGCVPTPSCRRRRSPSRRRCPRSPLKASGSCGKVASRSSSSAACGCDAESSWSPSLLGGRRRPLLRACVEVAAIRASRSRPSVRRGRRCPLCGCVPAHG